MASDTYLDGVLGRMAVIVTVIVLILILASCTVSPPQWQIYGFHDGAFAALPDTRETIIPYAIDTTLSPPATPSEWDVTAVSLVDVTGDGEPEWVLLVWRPWRDWPIQEWVSAPSPISDFHDAGGNSCHLILLDPGDGHEIWAGSALPAPLLALAVGDVNGDGLNEAVTLEGDYTTGRGGPASRVDVWAWNDFGFSLKWRSPEGTYHQLELIDSSRDGPLQIAVR